MYHLIEIDLTGYSKHYSRYRPEVFVCYKGDTWHRGSHTLPHGI